MAINKTPPTGRLIQFGKDEIIVSKTDLKGIITYANDVFMRIAGYSEDELNGANHNLIRHPEMPRCVFKLLWDTIQSGREIFAYVLNLAKNGDAYWVFAHVTPSLDDQGRCIGYHSNRRVPSQDALNKVAPLYRELLAIEKRHPDKASGMRASMAALENRLQEAGQDYDQFVFSLSQHTALEASL